MVAAEPTRVTVRNMTSERKWCHLVIVTENEFALIRLFGWAVGAIKQRMRP